MRTVILQSVVNLQAMKEHQYGVEWKKRGFVSAYFNTGRKLERLVTMWKNGWALSNDGDTRVDTLVDLMNYSILNLLLHGEKYPQLLDEALGKYELSFDYKQIVTNRHGFQYFCESILSPLLQEYSEQDTTLPERIEKLIVFAQKSVDGWLNRLAEVSEEKASGRVLYDGEFHPQQRIEQLLSLVIYSYFALASHIQEHPDEWETFIERYRIDIIL